MDILTEAGLSPEAAEREVTDIIRRRSDRVPALARGAPAALVRSSVGTLTGSTLSRVFYDQPSAAPVRKPDLQRIARLHQRLAGRVVPVEEYLRGRGE